jgi:hypothetical protein
VGAALILHLCFLIQGAMTEPQPVADVPGIPYDLYEMLATDLPSLPVVGYDTLTVLFVAKGALGYGMGSPS